MALDPRSNPPVASALSVSTGPAPQRFNWWGLGLTPILILSLLGMTQAWLYGWAKVQQKQVDQMRMAVERVRAQVREKSYRYAVAMSQFQPDGDDTTDYQPLTPDRVVRIPVDVELPTETVQPLPTGRRQAPERLAAAIRFLQTQWGGFTRYLQTGNTGAVRSAEAAALPADSAHIPAETKGTGD